VGLSCAHLSSTIQTTFSHPYGIPHPASLCMLQPSSIHTLEQLPHCINSMARLAFTYEDLEANDYDILGVSAASACLFPGLILTNMSRQMVRAHCREHRDEYAGMDDETITRKLLEMAEGYLPLPIRCHACIILGYSRETDSLEWANEAVRVAELMMESVEHPGDEERTLLMQSRECLENAKEAAAAEEEVSDDEDDETEESDDGGEEDEEGEELSAANDADAVSEAAGSSQRKSAP
jgi:hypothetical protein